MAGYLLGRRYSCFWVAYEAIANGDGVLEGPHIGCCSHTGQASLMRRDQAVTDPFHTFSPVPESW